MIRYCTILFDEMNELKISMHEYALANLIYNMCMHPESKKAGWCYASLTFKSKLFGLSRNSIINLQESLIQKGLVEKDAEGHTRTTAKWFKTIVLARDIELVQKVDQPVLPGQESLFEVVKKVDSTGAKSGPNIYNDIYNDNYKEFAFFLRDSIKQNNPKEIIPETHVKGWCNDFRLMVERDKRTLEEIRAVLTWSQKDPFWMFNILSGGKFRKQFARLHALMNKKEYKRDSPQSGEKELKYVPRKKPVTV